jgi:hypothetical protein
MDASTKRRLMLLAWIFTLPFLISGGGVHGLKTGGAFVIVFLLGFWVVATIIDFFHDVARFFNRPVEHHHYIHHEQTQQGHPDIEGTAARHPDPTRPDEEEWVGAITYRLHKGKDLR